MFCPLDVTVVRSEAVKESRGMKERGKQKTARYREREKDRAAVKKEIEKRRKGKKREGE